MKLMHIVTFFATEVVLLRKLGKNEVEPSNKPYFQPVTSKKNLISNLIFLTKQPQ
jgi:hypothetical protein